MQYYVNHEISVLIYSRQTLRLSLSMAESNDIHYKKGPGLLICIVNSAYGPTVADAIDFQGIYRTGAGIDISNIASKIAPFLDVKYVFKENLKSAEILSFLQDQRDIVEQEGIYHSLILLISSHGERNTIVGIDEQVIDIEEGIIRPFNNENFRGLRGKPKTFIFNCCRGDMDPSPLLRSNMGMDGFGGGPFKTKSVTQIEAISRDGDTLTIYSTTKGHSSYRYRSLGSPLIHVISSIINDLAAKHEISRTTFQTLAAMVQQKMYQEFNLQMEYTVNMPKNYYLPCKGKYNDNLYILDKY